MTTHLSPQGEAFSERIHASLLHVMRMCLSLLKYKGDEKLCPRRKMTRNVSAKEKIFHIFVSYGVLIFIPQQTFWWQIDAHLTSHDYRLRLWKSQGWLWLIIAVLTPANSSIKHFMLQDSVNNHISIHEVLSSDDATPTSERGLDTSFKCYSNGKLMLLIIEENK